MKREIKPVGNRLLIKVLEQEKTRGGIILAKKHQRIAWCRGKVVAKGPGYHNPETGELVPIADVDVGDEIIYEKYSGVEVAVDGEEYRMIQRTSVVAVVGADDHVVLEN
jgi:chaperonin GroES